MQIFYQNTSKNYDLRPSERNPIKFIILHYTELSFEEAVFKLCSPKSNVSAHYLIKKNGDIFQLVGEFYRAWHAGISYWKGEEALNNSSLGIEIDNLGNEAFTNEQMNSVIALCKFLMKKYNISRDNVLAHSDIAPNRKIDPGVFFDWHLLARNGIGMKFPKTNELDLKFPLLKTKDIINLQTKLKQLGYNIEITGSMNKQTSDVIRAFQLHFNPKVILAQGNIESIFQLEKQYLWDNCSDKILGLLTS